MSDVRSASTPCWIHTEWSDRELDESLSRVRTKAVETHVATALSLITTMHKLAHRTKPRIFVSYPSGSREIAWLIMHDPELCEHFEFIDYQHPNGEDKVLSAVEFIREADFVIFLWGPDKAENASSVWIPFEWGCAAIIGRPAHHLRHLRVPEHQSSIRIDSRFVPLTYNEPARFSEKVLPQLRDALKRDWPGPTRSNR
jgi:hypothetical protein